MFHMLINKKSKYIIFGLRLYCIVTALQMYVVFTISGWQNILSLQVHNKKHFKSISFSRLTKTTFYFCSNIHEGANKTNWQVMHLKPQALSVYRLNY